MTSKEAMEKLKENFENDVYKVEREMLDIIDKDLVLDKAKELKIDVASTTSLTVAAYERLKEMLKEIVCLGSSKKYCTISGCSF